MDYLCTKFSGFTFNRFGFIVRTESQMGINAILTWLSSAWVNIQRALRNWQQATSSPVSIQTQSLALSALRKLKPQETQALALASSQWWLPLLRPSIPIFWCLRLLRENSRLLREIFTQQTQAPANRNARSKQWQPSLAACQRACVSCGFRLRNACNAIEWKPGFSLRIFLSVHASRDDDCIYSSDCDVTRL